MDYKTEIMNQMAVIHAEKIDRDSRRYLKNTKSGNQKTTNPVKNRKREVKPCL